MAQKRRVVKGHPALCKDLKQKLIDRRNMGVLTTMKQLVPLKKQSKKVQREHHAKRFLRCDKLGSSVHEAKPIRWNIDITPFACLSDTS